MIFSILSDPNLLFSDICFFMHRLTIWFYISIHFMCTLCTISILNNKYQHYTDIIRIWPRGSSGVLSTSALLASATRWLWCWLFALVTSPDSSSDICHTTSINQCTASQLYFLQVYTSGRFRRGCKLNMSTALHGNPPQSYETSPDGTCNGTQGKALPINPSQAGQCLI